MTRPAAIALILLALGTASAQAQGGFFDMTPERGGAPLPQAQPPARPPAPTAPVGPGAAPQAAPPAAATPQPAAPAPAAQPAPAARPSPLAEARRYLSPFEQLALSGEVDRRTWTVVLTGDQAAAAAKLHVGYQNAIVVAPELSRLKVAINGETVVDQPVSSADDVAQLVFDVRPGLLRVGPNIVSFATEMRHRTDCTIQSTYELWAEIDTASTYLSFADAGAARLGQLEEIGAVGVGPNGQTEFEIVAPSFDAAAATPALMRLAEGLALTANMPNQSVRIVREPAGGAAPGKLTVAVGTATELAGVLGAMPPAAAVSPLVAFVDDPKLGASTLVVSGPTWPAVVSGIDSIVGPYDRPAQAQRPALATHNWRTPDAPLVTGADNRLLSELGLTTSEFPGRRFRTDFAFGIPSDFYAEAYGAATILVDAAYTPAVRPGSRLDIYVNGNIATTVPLSETNGAILRQFPVRVTMRHFRPGTNVVTIEAVLMTRADEACAPGATALTEPRFVLFDTSRFVMPDFARIARRPDLAGISGTGFPYNRASDPVALFVERRDSDTLSAAATFMARLSLAAGRPIPVDMAISQAAAGDGNAIFVGTLESMRPDVLVRLGISEESRTAWNVAAPAVGTERSDPAVTLERWRDELSGSGWRGGFSRFEDWTRQKFDISLDSLRLLPSEAPVYTPPRNATLMVAQETSPGDAGTWTMVTAPTAAALRDGARLLATEDNWSRVAGHITTLDGDGSVASVAVTRFHFFPTQQASFRNYRLIAANWLSENTLTYAIGLFAFCVMLGLATAGLLTILGRRK